MRKIKIKVNIRAGGLKLFKHCLKPAAAAELFGASDLIGHLIADISAFPILILYNNFICAEGFKLVAYTDNLTIGRKRRYRAVRQPQKGFLGLNGAVDFKKQPVFFALRVLSELCFKITPVCVCHCVIIERFFRNRKVSDRIIRVCIYFFLIHTIGRCRAAVSE